eukprot:gene7588-743_t
MSLHLKQFRSLLLLLLTLLAFKLYVFGGRTGDADTKILGLYTAEEWDLDSLSVSPMTLLGTEDIPGRAGHSAVFWMKGFSSFIIVFGGVMSQTDVDAKSEFLNDVLSLDVGKTTWSTIVETINTPLTVKVPSLDAIPSTSSAALLEMSSQQEVNPHQHMSHQQGMNRHQEKSPQKLKVEILFRRSSSESCPLPPYRASPGMAAVASDFIIVFGGWTSAKTVQSVSGPPGSTAIVLSYTLMKDLWVLDIRGGANKWYEVDISVSGSFPEAFAPGYQVVLNITEQGNLDIYALGGSRRKDSGMTPVQRSSRAADLSTVKERRRLVVKDTGSADDAHAHSHELGIQAHCEEPFCSSHGRANRRSRRLLQPDQEEGVGDLLQNSLTVNSDGSIIDLFTTPLIDYAGGLTLSFVKRAGFAVTTNGYVLLTGGMQESSDGDEVTTTSSSVLLDIVVAAVVVAAIPAVLPAVFLEAAGGILQLTVVAVVSLTYYSEVLIGLYETGEANPLQSRVPGPAVVWTKAMTLAGDTQFSLGPRSRAASCPITSKLIFLFGGLTTNSSSSTTVRTLHNDLVAFSLLVGGDEVKRIAGEECHVGGNCSGVSSATFVGMDDLPSAAPMLKPTPFDIKEEFSYCCESGNRLKITVKGSSEERVANSQHFKIMSWEGTELISSQELEDYSLMSGPGKDAESEWIGIYTIPDGVNLLQVMLISTDGIGWIDKKDTKDKSAACCDPDKGAPSGPQAQYTQFPFEQRGLYFDTFEVQPQYNTTVPVARHGHAMAFVKPAYLPVEIYGDKGVVAMYGGSTDTDLVNASLLLDDLWIFVMSNHTWVKLIPGSTTRPPALYGHSLAVGNLGQ